MPSVVTYVREPKIEKLKEIKIKRKKKKKIRILLIEIGLNVDILSLKSLEECLSLYATYWGYFNKFDYIPESVCGKLFNI